MEFLNVSSYVPSISIVIKQKKLAANAANFPERETRLEPATSTLGRLRSANWATLAIRKQIYFFGVFMQIIFEFFLDW